MGRLISLPESALSVPARDRDDIDVFALRVWCPSCGARRGCPCWWAVAGIEPSWTTHDERRRIHVFARAHDAVLWRKLSGR